MDYLVFFLTPILIYFFNSYIVKKKLLTNFSGENHQKFLGTKNSPLSGGIFLILFLLIIFIQTDLLTYVFLIFIFMLGLFSDLKIITLPLRRLFYQFILILLFVYFLSLDKISTRIIFLDYFLQNYYIGIFLAHFV